MHFLLCPLGTSGDVHPFLGVGLRLREHGHRVTIITHTNFGPLVRQYGFDYVDLNDEPDYSQTHGHPDAWHPTRGSKHGARFFLRSTMRQYYQAVTERYVPGETVTVSNHSGFGGRMAHEKIGVPYVTLQVCPAYAFSVRRPPRFAFWRPPDWSPAWFKAFYFWVGDRAIIDPLVGPEVNRFRADLGLPPIRGVLRWLQSPQLIIGLFPDWFAQPRPEDWPAHLVTTHFPLFDERTEEHLPPEVEEFVAAGEPPVLFTAGTGMQHAHEFFAAAADACKRLGRRGMLLTRHPDQIPAQLPPGVQHFAFLPFGLLLPRIAAAVFHGGIGTVAQALRAGVPQLIMPMAHDQPDNADRLVKLGVGRMLWPRHFTGPAVARELHTLLDDPAVARRCRDLATRFPADPVAPTVEVLERFAARKEP
jgi:UDP:flavonoid glycosyltransferase YjiC (YdhE family)